MIASTMGNTGTKIRFTRMDTGQSPQAWVSRMFDEALEPGQTDVMKQDVEASETCANRQCPSSCLPLHLISWQILVIHANLRQESGAIGRVISVWPGLKGLQRILQWGYAKGNDSLRYLGLSCNGSRADGFAESGCGCGSGLADGAVRIGCRVRDLDSQGWSTGYRRSGRREAERPLCRPGLRSAPDTTRPDRSPRQARRGPPCCSGVSGPGYRPVGLFFIGYVE